MCSIAGRNETVLVVIDVQVAVVASAWERDAVVGRIADLVAAARRAGVPVVWVQHSEPELPIGSDGWQLVPELVPAPTEPIIRKRFRSTFEDTDFDEVLARLDAAHLVVCGAETNNCVRFTAHAAIERGYDVTLVADAHTTTSMHWEAAEEWPAVHLDAADIVAEANVSFWHYAVPGRDARVAKAAAVVRAMNQA